jgi:uncharacterized protein YkwD
MEVRIFLPMLACALALLGSLAEATPPAPWIHDIVSIFESAEREAPERLDELDRAASLALEADQDADLRHVLRSHGVHDGLLLPVLLVDPEEPTVRRRWQMLLRDQVATQGLTHFGVARQGERLAVIFVRRAFYPSGPPTRDPDGRHLVMSGLLERGYSEPVVYITRPDQRVVSFEPIILGRQVEFRVPTAPGATSTVEMIAAGPRGAEVVALLTVDENGIAATTTRTDGQHGRWEGTGMASELIGRINRDRGTLGLGALSRDPVLQRTASEHAKNMARMGVVAHVLPGGAPPAARLGDAGIRTRRFFENVAMARSVAQAHDELWASPSHRMALTDDLITHIGVGVARTLGADGPMLYVVEHVAHR